MIRKKKIAGINVLDIWFDTDIFRKGSKGVYILHSNDELDRENYDFCLGGKTFLLDISRPLEEIFAGFDYKSCRYGINRANRDGIVVWKVENREDFEQYLSFQQKFCAEKEIPNVIEADIEEMDIFCAKSAEDEFLGGCAFLESADHQTIRYKYGATSHKCNANESILWEAICYYHEKGCHYFDFGGCVPTEDRESYYYRHYHFKKKFGGKLVESYTYFRIHGFFRIFYYAFNFVLKIFFHNDVNSLVIWLNRIGMIK